jgi:hypothetical protein
MPSRNRMISAASAPRIFWAETSCFAHDPVCLVREAVPHGVEATIMFADKVGIPGVIDAPL